MTTIAVEPIRTKADHQTALRRVEELMGAKPGTADDDELEILTDLIEAYERRHFEFPRASEAEVLPRRQGQAGDHVTPEEMLLLADEGRGFDLIDGILMERNVGMESSRAGVRVAILLGKHVDATGSGWIYGTDMGFRIFTSPATVLRQGGGGVH